ncbi:MAG: hypothetical protein ACPGWR_27570 [Ardenticatenaceae bacterium]
MAITDACSTDSRTSSVFYRLRNKQRVLATPKQAACSTDSGTSSVFYRLRNKLRVLRHYGTLLGGWAL